MWPEKILSELPNRLATPPDRPGGSLFQTSITKGGPQVVLRNRFPGGYGSSRSKCRYERVSLTITSGHFGGPDGVWPYNPPLLLFAIITIEVTMRATSAQEDPSSQKKEIARIRMGELTRQRVHRVAPEYPHEARKKRMQGTVRLHIMVGTEGRVQQKELLSGPEVLQKSSLDAVRQWTYKPTLLNSRPVEVDTTST